MNGASEMMCSLVVQASQAGFSKGRLTLAGITCWPAWLRGWSISLMRKHTLSFVWSDRSISCPTLSSGINSHISSSGLDHISNLVDNNDLNCLSFGTLGPFPSFILSLSWPIGVVMDPRRPLLLSFFTLTSLIAWRLQ